MDKTYTDKAEEIVNKSNELLSTIPDSEVNSNDTTMLLIHIAQLLQGILSVNSIMLDVLIQAKKETLDD